MNQSKEEILRHIKDYFKLKKIKYSRFNGFCQEIACPKCGQLKVKILPNHYKIACLPCGHKFTLIDVVRIKEKKDSKEEDILQYLKELLNISVTTEKEGKELNDLLEFYHSQGFDLVPVARNAKNPIEKNWTNKEHKDIQEWSNWLANDLNIGVKTGARSNITVIDIDTKEMPEILKNVKTLIQETKKGYHYFFKYESELPKTRIDEYKIDIENDGGQVVIHPSMVEGIGRKVIIEEIIQMTPEILEFFKSKVTVPRQTESEKIKENIQTENFKIDPKDFELKNKGLDGCCNSSFVSLGGVLRKELTSYQTEFVLQTLNQCLLEKPMEKKTIVSMCKELERYACVDEKDIAHKILTYLREAESATKFEIADAVYGGRVKGEDKKRMDKSLVYLIKEGYIIKAGRTFHIIKKAEWKEELAECHKPLGFEVPYFDEEANFNWGDLILIGSRAKYGKCLAKGTKILMSNGLTKKVENIVLKDKLMGIDSKPREVINIAVGKSTMYEINPKWSNSFTVNDEHILCLKNSMTQKKINISVKDYLLKNKSFKRYHKLYSVPIDFPESNLSIDPYFLGLWLGDGDSTNPRITTKDKEIVDYLKKYSKTCGQQLQTYAYPNRCFSYAITYGKQGHQNLDSLHTKMKKINIFKNKHIPDIYKINSRKNRLQLLAGLIDSDGNLNSKKTGYEITSNKINLVLDILYLARSLGYRAYYKERFTKCNSKKFKSYRIIIGGDCHLIPVKIKRKKAKKLKIWKNHLLYNFNVKKLKKEKYYGFMVDKDHLYLLENFIVNHNTHISMNIVKQLVDQGITPYYISLETGSRFQKIALKLGLKEGDFKHTFCVDPTKIELEKNAVTIIDWLLIVDKSKTDLVFRHLIEQLNKTNGFLIVFQQLKEIGDGKGGKKAEWFAPNMVKQFPALATRYLYHKENDGTYGSFHLDVIREPKRNVKVWEIPCEYNWDEKTLKRVTNNEKTELEEEKNELG